MTSENMDDIKIQKFKEDWVMALMQRGIVVKLHISRWGARKQITPSDLGLKFADAESEKFAKRYLKLGSQKLFPPDIINEITYIEQKARENLNDYSYDTVWGRFIPITVFDEWKRKDTVIRNDFIQASKMLEIKYDEIIQRVRADYSELAKDVWARLYPQDQAGPSVGFVVDFVDRIIAKIPNMFMISNSFKYSTVYYTIPMPSVIASDMVKADEIKQKAKMEEATRQKISEQFLSQKKELIDDFLEATVVSMRKSIRQLCEGVLKSIEKNSGKEIEINLFNKMNAMIVRVRKMNFYDDAEITQLLNGLELEIGKYKGDADEEVITNTLKKIVMESSKDFLPNDFNPSIDTLEVE